MSAPQGALAPEENPSNWIPLLESAAREVFDLMLRYELALPPEKFELRPTELDITAIVGLAGDLKGRMSIRCNTDSARRMACRMLGLEDGGGEDEMWDAVGEICNLFAGNVKHRVPGLAAGFVITIPTVIEGRDYHLQRTAEAVLFHKTLMFEEAPVVFSMEVIP